MLPGIFITQRQPEIADETGNIYIARTITDNIKIPNSKSGVHNHVALEKSVGKWLR